MTTPVVALYARVSSEQQAQAQTIDSQLVALRERIASDGGLLSPAHEFVDAGYSGSTLIRPALERLRDAVAAGEVARVYVYRPDRLARKYAYQVMLVDEFRRAGVDLVVFNRPLGQSPEEELLLQMQGMIAEYERAQMLERSRRGKRHKAQQGSVNVLGGAPYGYRYVTRIEGGGEARYEIDEEQAPVVRQIFDWVGCGRLSIGDVQRRLTAATTLSPAGKTGWDRTTIWGILKNPAYKGQAAFGETRAGELRPRLREQRGRALQPRRARSSYDQPPEHWLSIPVPALVDEALFATVQAQLEENRRRTRSSHRGAKYLLQGLLVCGCCGYAFYGKPLSARARKHRPRDYAYYRCAGSDAYRFGGQRLCDNKPVRTDRLEQAVWSEVGRLLAEPARLADEYQRRLAAVQASPGEIDAALIDQQIAKLRQGIARLIDGYAEGYLDRAEAEPRIRRFKERLQALEAQAEQRRAQAQQHVNLQLVIGRLEEFGTKVKTGLEQLDWAGRRELIRTLVKRVEISQDSVNVVFRVDETAFPPGNNPVMQHCGGNLGATLRLSFGGYALEAAGPVLLGLLATWSVIAWQARGRWSAPPAAAGTRPDRRADDQPAFDPWQTAKGLTVAAILLGVFLFTAWPREAAALVGAGVLLTSRRLHSRHMLGLVDWELLVLFVGLFVVNHAFQHTGLAAEAVAGLAAAGVPLDRPGPLFAATVLLSNLVSNVPAVMLLLPAATHPQAGAILALASTLAGNLLLVGSIANLIVADAAARRGIRLDWRGHARAGVPVTLATLAICAGYGAWRLGG